ncbi:MAG: GNAT family N-acetyltransferase [Thermoplasmata archaeon]
MVLRVRGLRIRELEPGDYEELVALWRRAGLPFRPRGRDSRREILRQLSLPTSVYLKAVVGRGVGKREVIAGVVLGTHDGRKGWVNRLAVLPEYRRRGVARALVRELERRFRRMGIGVFCALVEDWNRVSLKAFRAMGYELHRDIFYFSKRRSRGA